MNMCTKTLKIKLFLIISVFICLQIKLLGQKNETPEQLARVVFEALSKKDSVLSNNAKISEAEFKFLIQGVPEKELDEKEAEKIYSEYCSNFDFCFRKTIEMGETEGVVWSETIYINSEFYKRPGSDADFVEIGKTYLKFKFNNKIYGVKIGDSILIDGNWVVEDYIQWEGEQD